MRIAIFAASSNPSIDPPILHKSLSYVQQRIGDYIQIGPRAYQARPKFETHTEHLIAAGTFAEAWKMTPSGPAKILVWQLQT